MFFHIESVYFGLRSGEVYSPFLILTFTNIALDPPSLLWIQQDRYNNARAITSNIKNRYHLCVFMHHRYKIVLEKKY